jgi:hypothetical protein
MRSTLCLWTLIAVAAACSGGNGTGASSDGGGPMGTGGSALGGTGGSALGGAGGSAAGGAGGQAQSPGMVTVQVTVAPGSAYCDVESFCNLNHFGIRDQSGQPINITPPSCAPTCAQGCVRPACPGLACIESGMAYTGGRHVWTGAVYDVSTCGAGIQCFRERFLPPGRYVAVACATPGTVAGPDGGASNPTCKKTGERECVEATFDLPATGPVELVLGLSSVRDR